MSNPRSASNAWAKIRNKLMTPGDGTSSPKAKETPKKKGTTKANGKSKGDDQNGDGASVTPKSRKRASKKQDVDGDASPTKKSRPSKANTVADVEDSKCFTPFANLNLMLTR
jgi:hypothetical protein